MASAVAVTASTGVAASLGRLQGAPARIAPALAMWGRPDIYWWELGATSAPDADLLVFRSADVDVDVDVDGNVDARGERVRVR